MIQPPDRFDVDGPAATDGLFGLPCRPDEPAIVVIPVPWEGTVSSGRGTSGGPAAVLRASWQVELFHPVWGDAIWKAGMAMEEADPRIAAWNERAIADRSPTNVDPLSLEIDRIIEQRCAAAMDAGRLPAILGGEHSVALGGILEAAARHPGIGVLHVDAHADLRVAYEGLSRSHASVMHNLLALGPPGVTLVQVGLRDMGRAEHARTQDDPRVHPFLDCEIAADLARGTPWAAIAGRILDALPERVWVSFDVDGLDPSLAPHTGTPVPGGLSWRDATFLLRELARSGRKVVGFDVCETGDHPFDAGVSARLLWELAGCALKAR